MAIPKVIPNGKRQPLEINNHSLEISSDIIVMSSLLALQTDPQHWGADSLMWRPSRWITCPPSETDNTTLPNRSSSLGDKLEQENIMQPAPGTFFPWVDGARICPGKQFAQVETVAVLAGLLRTKSVKPAIQEGEDITKARQQMLDMVNDSVQGLLLHIRDPTRVPLVWTAREEHKAR